MSKTINAILVDDEPGCIRNLQYYLDAYCPDINVTGTASDMDSARKLLGDPAVDLAFLDVQLFDRSIFDLFPDGAAPRMPVVFVTAYEKYALSALRASALDYLVKPLEQAEILRCYLRIIRHFEQSPAPVADAPAKVGRILLRQGERLYPTSVDNLLFLEANGFYTTVFFRHEGKIREVMVSKPINTLHHEWDAPALMRVHRSYVINIGQVSSLRRNGANLSLAIADREIPVAKRRTAEFLQKYHG